MDEITLTSSLNEVMYVYLSTPVGAPELPPSDSNVLLGVPFCLIGLSGIGKTKNSRDVCNALGEQAHYVYAGVKQPEDFNGAFYPTPDGLVIECILPAARKCIDAGRGVIVLDEVNGATARTQHALLSFVDERQCGDQLLPRRVRFILCMNPVDYAAGGHVLEGAFANRMAHVPYPVPSNQDWVRWLTGTTQELPRLADTEKLICERWFDHWPQMLGLAAGFAHKMPNDVLHKQPDPGSPAAGGPWPSPRTWYMGLRALCTARCLADQFPGAGPGRIEALEYDLLCCLVGQGPAQMWQAWIAESDLPSPTDMLTKGWKPDEKRLDRTVVCLTTITEFIKTRPRSEQIVYAVNAWKILQETMNVGLGDLILVPAQTLLNQGLGRTGISKGDITPDLKKISDDVTFELSSKKLTQYTPKS